MNASARPQQAPGNAWLAAQLLELAARLELAGTPYAPRAYRRAAESIEQRREPVAELCRREGEHGLETLPGVGPHIAHTLRELVETGHCKRLERLRREAPVDLMSLLAVDGVGPKTVKLLWERLDVHDLDGLEQALEAGEVERLPGFGPRRAARLREALRARQHGSARLRRAAAQRIAEPLRARLAAAPGVSECCIAGSIRRGRATVGDIDLVAAASDAAPVAQALLDWPEVEHVYSRGPRRVSVRLASEIDVDLRIVAPDSFGAALLYFTGSRPHTLALRRLALAQGLHLNEYGLYRGQRRIAGRTEEEVYAALSLQFIPPEERLGGAEIRDALHGAQARP